MLGGSRGSCGPGGRVNSFRPFHTPVGSSRHQTASFLPLSLPSFQGSLKWALHTVLDRMANVALGQCLGPIQLFPASHGLFFEAMYVLLFPTHSHHKNV